MLIAIMLPQVMHSGEITVHIHPCCSMHTHDDGACCREVRSCRRESGHGSLSHSSSCAKPDVMH